MFQIYKYNTIKIQRKQGGLQDPFLRFDQIYLISRNELQKLIKYRQIKLKQVGQQKLTSGNEPLTGVILFYNTYGLSLIHI